MGFGFRRSEGGGHITPPPTAARRGGPRVSGLGDPPQPSRTSPRRRSRGAGSDPPQPRLAIRHSLAAPRVAAQAGDVAAQAGDPPQPSRQTPMWRPTAARRLFTAFELFTAFSIVHRARQQDPLYSRFRRSKCGGPRQPDDHLSGDHRPPWPDIAATVGCDGSISWRPTALGAV